MKIPMKNIEDTQTPLPKDTHAFTFTYFSIINNNKND